MLGSSPLGLAFASATSIVNVFTDVARKKVLVKTDIFAATFWIRLIAAVVFSCVFAWHVYANGPLHFVNDTQPPLGPYVSHLPAIVTFLLYLFANTALVAISVLFYYRALQVSDLSMSIPFLSFTPALLVVTGAIFLREQPSPEKLVGIFLVVLGSLIMNKSAFRFGLLGPVRALFREKGSRYMLCVAAILSITNPLDKKLVMMSDAFTSAFAYGLMLWLLLTLVAAWQKADWSAPLRRVPAWLLLAGVLDAIDLLFQFASHKYMRVVITIALKRAGVVLAVLTGWLIFREKNIGERLLASAVMFSGVVILYLPVSMNLALFIALVAVCGLVVALVWNGKHQTPPLSSEAPHE
jgi:drug/metabolite transporter (DMT)-like permease